MLLVSICFHKLLAEASDQQQRNGNLRPEQLEMTVTMTVPGAVHTGARRNRL